MSKTRQFFDDNKQPVALWSREELEEFLNKQHQLRRLLERKIEILEKDRQFYRQWDFITCLCYFIGVVTFFIFVGCYEWKHPYVVTSGVLLMTISGFKVYNDLHKLLKRLYNNEDTTDETDIAEDVALLRDFNTAELKWRLASYLEDEEFEMAGICRDELKKRIL